MKCNSVNLDSCHTYLKPDKVQNMSTPLESESPLQPLSSQALLLAGHHCPDGCPVSLLQRGSHSIFSLGSVALVLLLSPAPRLEEPGVPPRTPLSYSQKFLWDSLCLSGNHVISLRFPLTSASCLTWVRGPPEAAAQISFRAECLRTSFHLLTSLCLPRVMGTRRLCLLPGAVVR